VNKPTVLSSPNMYRMRSKKAKVETGGSDPDREAFSNKPTDTPGSTVSMEVTYNETSGSISLIFEFGTEEEAI